MPFETIAEEIIVLEPLDQPMMSPFNMGHNHGSHHHHDHGSHHHHDHGTTQPMPMISPLNLGHEHSHSHMGHGHGGHSHEMLEVGEDPSLDLEPISIEIVVEDIPGAGNNLPPIVVEDEAEESDSDKKGKDENDARTSKKNDKWDWASKGAEGFVSWIKERIDTVPRHSGMDTAGLERAVSYLEKLDSEISKAMRLDLEGDLDANKIEEVRSKIDDGISRLNERLDKVKETKRPKKKKADEEHSGLVKEAQKITGVQGVYVTVPLLISRIARVCINGMVSAGHDIEDMYDRQVKMFKLNNREQAEVMQLLADMGYPMRQDRGFMPEDALEVSDSDGMDWASNYKG